MAFERAISKPIIQNTTNYNTINHFSPIFNVGKLYKSLEQKV